LDEPIVVTMDFVLTVNKGQGVFEVVRTIKMKDKLLDERVLEEFEIERKSIRRWHRTLAISMIIAIGTYLLQRLE